MTDPDAKTRAERLISLADAAIEAVDATQRAVEELLAEVARQRSAAVVPLEAGAGTALDSARLAAIEMAVAGRTRDEVARHIRAAYAVADVDALLDDVFGPPEIESRFVS